MSRIEKAKEKYSSSRPDSGKARLPSRTIFDDCCRTSFQCLVSMATTATGYESGKEDPFMVLIDEVYVISQNKGNQTA